MPRARGRSIVPGVGADAQQDGRSPNLEVLLPGGLPIREPVGFHGPFVMNTRGKIMQAVEDYHAGRMGTIPATYLATRGRGGSAGADAG